MFFFRQFRAVFLPDFPDGTVFLLICSEFYVKFIIFVF